MSPTVPAHDAPHEIEIFTHMARVTAGVMRINAKDVTHAESLIAPEAGGNCMNWVVGHVLHVYEQVLAGLRQPPVLGVAALARYARGSEPLTDPADALPFDQLLSAFDEASARVENALSRLPLEALDAPAPPEFGRNLREMYGFIFFHQAYHVGQVGVLRRVAGHPGGVR